MIITNNAKIAKYAKLLINQAKKSDFEYIHEEVGYNYKMNNLCASVGLSQINKLNFFLKKKREIFQFYKKEFLNNEFIKIIETPKYSKNNHWMPLIKVNIKRNFSSKKKFIDELKKKNIEVRGCWDPLHNQKPYRKYQNFNIGNLLSFSENIFCLPCSTQISLKDLKYVSKNLQKLVS